MQAEIDSRKSGFDPSRCSVVKHIVGFSGGIDSQATARWVLNHYPKEDVIILNSDAGGNEHPITTEFIQWYSENVHPVVTVSAVVGDLGGRAKEKRSELELSDDDPMDFSLLATIKGMFPCRTIQFCTEALKLAPQNRWIKEHLISNGVGYRRYSGVRREEGVKNNSWRASAEFEKWDDYFGCPLHHPLADWTKKMCFDYVQHHDGSFNELYKLGFDRVGCSPCVNANKMDIRNWAIRFPEMIDKVREWELKTGFTFFRMPRKDGSLRWIDDVVKWSKTVRGGKQMSLEVLYQPLSCDSQYGLCE